MLIESGLFHEGKMVQMLSAANGSSLCIYLSDTRSPR